MAGVVSAILLLCAVLWLGLAPRLARATAQTAPAPAATAVRLPLRTWENYFGTTILSTGRGIVVGDKGLVMVTDDKGQSWTRQQLHKGPNYFDLYSVAFTPDGQQGWAVGDGGAIYHSSDSGHTWQMQESKVAAALLKVAVIDEHRICAVGEHGTVLCSSDGGSTWKLQKFEDLVFFDVAFTDPQNGFAVGEFATALHTVDGGKNWTTIVGGQRSISADPYFAIAFADPHNGIAFGLNGADMVTSDGGQTWKPGTLGGESHSVFAAIPKPGGSALYVGGADGSIGSVDHDKFAAVDRATSNTVTSVAMSPAYGLAVGLAGTVLRSENLGQTWDSVTNGKLIQTQAKAE
jgi:photosystem II stability/assembly factor-like uncharacterized protein